MLAVFHSIHLGLWKENIQNSRDTDDDMQYLTTREEQMLQYSHFPFFHNETKEYLGKHRLFAWPQFK